MKLISLTKVTNTWAKSVSLTNPILLGNDAARMREGLESLVKQIALTEAVLPNS